MKDIIIMGGGVIGLMCAYSLNKDGRKVTIIDEGDLTDSSSSGNAGMICPYEVTPLAKPGIIIDTIKLMLRGKSPLLIHPTLDINTYKWLLKFILSTTPERVKKTLILFEKYGHQSVNLYTKMMEESNLDFDFHQDGILLLYTELESFIKEVKKTTDRTKFRILNKEETIEHVPFMNNNIQGSILSIKDGSLDPDLMMKNLHRYLESQGVEFLLNEEVIDLELKSSKVTKVITTKDSYSADTIIMATGAYASLLAKKAGTNLLLAPGKGYSITFEIDEALKPKTPVLFSNQFIACSPRRNDMRLTSKLELASKNRLVDKEKIDSIVSKLKEYSIDFEMKNQKLWAGFRPMTPNEMPLIGRDENYQNLIYATGLGRLGITFGPIIGKIVSDLVIRDESNAENVDVLLLSGFYQGC